MKPRHLGMVAILKAVGLLLIALRLCGPAVSAPAVAEARTDREALRRATARYEAALRATDADMLAATFTSDGELVHDGQVLARGPEDIRLFLLAGKLAVQIESFRMPVDAIKMTGNQATVRGHFQQTAFMLLEQDTITTKGTFVILWLRTKNGGWLIRRLETRTAGS